MIAISGLDGAGKSFQARALQNTLELLVCPTVVEWTPLGQNRAIEIARSAKKLVRRFDHDTPTAEPVLPMSYADLPANPAQRLRGRSALITRSGRSSSSSTPGFTVVRLSVIRSPARS